MRSQRLEDLPQHGGDVPIDEKVFLPHKYVKNMCQNHRAVAMARVKEAAWPSVITLFLGAPCPCHVACNCPVHLIGQQLAW